MGVSIRQSEVTVGGSLAGWELVLRVAVVSATAVGLAWAVLQAWTRRLEAHSVEPILAARLDQLETLSHDVETLQAKLAQVEQRLEFAERLLPRPTEPPEA